VNQGVNRLFAEMAHLEPVSAARSSEPFWTEVTAASAIQDERAGDRRITAVFGRKPRARDLM
jgi:hypothetical protein